MTETLVLPAAGHHSAGLIDGPAGALEVELGAPDAGEVRALSVICHPHPMYGGALTNKVVYALARSAQASGYAALRFNFRGVGKSSGAYDRGVGEIEDACAAAAWLREQYPERPLVIQGFSFGAFISLCAAARLEARGLVTISVPAAGYLERAAPPSPDCPWLAVHSRDDDVVAYDDTAAMLKQYQPAPHLATLDGAGHFYHGHLNELRDIVQPFLVERLL
jgi:hypothetical protein